MTELEPSSPLGIVGAGLMGVGIAVVFAKAGYHVVKIGRAHV